jgi:hypothetical protein
MPDFDSSTFSRSVAGQLLRRLVDVDASGAPPSSYGIGPRDLSALADLERMGYVLVRRGSGAMAWMIESIALTDEGRTRAAAM